MLSWCAGHSSVEQGICRFHPLFCGGAKLFRQAVWMIAGGKAAPPPLQFGAFQAGMQVQLLADYIRRLLLHPRFYRLSFLFRLGRSLRHALNIEQAFKIVRLAGCCWRIAETHGKDGGSKPELRRAGVFLGACVSLDFLQNRCEIRAVPQHQACCTLCDEKAEARARVSRDGSTGF